TSGWRARVSVSSSPTKSGRRGAGRERSAVWDTGFPARKHRRLAEHGPVHARAADASDGDAGRPTSQRAPRGLVDCRSPAFGVLAKTTKCPPEPGVTCLAPGPATQGEGGHIH